MAVKKGVVSSKASQEELVDAIFLGVSTTKEVSEVSGRGFGLNIVKKRVESVGGSVSVATEPENGTSFTIEVPLSLAIIEALFVGVGGVTYAIPVANIERLITVDKKDIKGFSAQSARILNNYDWPGNVRELENAVERAVVMARNEFIEPENLPWKDMNIDIVLEATGIFERVFTTSHAYRAEPSLTTRHMTEYVGMDAEMGFINSREDSDGTNRLIENSMLKAMTGYTKDLGNDLRIGFQYYYEQKLDYDSYRDNLLAGDYFFRGLWPEPGIARAAIHVNRQNPGLACQQQVLGVNQVNS